MLALSTSKFRHVRNGRRDRRVPMARKLSACAAAVLARLKGLAPYAVLVLVVPGGLLMAPLLWLHRRSIRSGALTRPLRSSTVGALRVQRRGASLSGDASGSMS